MTEAQAPELPVGSLLDAIPYLRRPFTSASVKWKIQSIWPKEGDPRMGQVVAYIDARLVIARLNLVCPTLWEEDYEILALPGPNDKAMKVKCWLTVDGRRRQGEGVGRGAEAFKGAHSDALKRAGVKFDVGQSIYALPAIRMFAGEGAGKLPVKGQEGKRTLRIEAEQLEFLRSRYETWLETDAGKTFGEPLDHGDVLGAQGDPVDPDAPEEDELTESLFEDDEAPPPRPTGRKISAADAQKLAERIAAKKITPADVLGYLATIGARVNGDAAEALKGLRASQAVQLEEWIATR